MALTYDATFVRLLSGEIGVVLAVDSAKHRATVGTRRLSKLFTDKYVVLRMFVDGLVFQSGTIIVDHSSQGVGEKNYRYWHDPWICKGDTWQPYPEYCANHTIEPFAS